MMEKVNVKKKIGFTIIILTIILLNIFIGSNIKQPIWIIQTVLCIFMTVYLIISKINKKRDIIIKGKIDIAVFAFMIATTVPLLLKTYVSLEGTINFILKYWSVYGMYILVRNIVTDEKKEKIIIDIFIISSIIPIIFGIDKLTFNLLAPLLELIDAVKIDDVRMISTFGYANTLAAYLSLTTCLAISELANSEKIRNKIAYIIYIIIASITIILTQSKFVIALILFIIMLFVIKGIKDKKISKKCILTGGLIIVAFFIYFFIPNYRASLHSLFSSSCYSGICRCGRLGCRRWDNIRYFGKKFSPPLKAVKFRLIAVRPVDGNKAPVGAGVGENLACVNIGYPYEFLAVKTINNGIRAIRGHVQDHLVSGDISAAKLGNYRVHRGQNCAEIGIFGSLRPGEYFALFPERAVKAVNLCEQVIGLSINVHGIHGVGAYFIAV